MSDLVAEQRDNIGSWKTGTLMTPAEQVYVPTDSAIAEYVGPEAE